MAKKIDRIPRGGFPEEYENLTVRVRKEKRGREQTYQITSELIGFPGAKQDIPCKGLEFISCQVGRSLQFFFWIVLPGSTGPVVHINTKEQKIFSIEAE